MGARGPIGKRSTERVRRNKDAAPRTAKLTGKVTVPAPSKEWHAVPARWYRALKASGQSVYFEPSDWAEAYATAELWTRELERVRVVTLRTGEELVVKVPPSAEMMKVIAASMSKLGTTESDRRRMRIEVERQPSSGTNPADDGIPVLDDYRAALAG
jgi:hypothetical protein